MVMRFVLWAHVEKSLYSTQNLSGPDLRRWESKKTRATLLEGMTRPSCNCRSKISLISLKLPPRTRTTGQQSPFSPHVGGKNSSPMRKTLGAPAPILWCLPRPVQDEQVLDTKLQLTKREAGRGLMYILGFGRVKDR